MLFEIPKTLFADALGRIGPAMVENTDPVEKGQYLIMKGNGSSFSAWIKRQDITAMVEIDSPNIKIGTEFKNTVQGKALYDVLARTNISGDVRAEFEANQNADAAEAAAEETEEGEEEGAPAQEPVPNIGNVLFLIPSTRKQPEKLRIPSVQWSAEPDVNLKGANRMTVGAAELGTMISKIEIAYERAAQAQYKNCLLRTRGDRFQLTLMEPASLAKIDGKLINASKEFDACVGYDSFRQAIKMLNPEQDVEIIINEGSPGTMILAQEVSYGDVPVGKCYLRISCAKESFTPFEKKLAKLSFRYTASFKRQQLAELCAKIEAVGGKEVKFTPDGDTFKLSQRGQKGSIEELVIDAGAQSGDPFEFKSYSKFWKSVAGKANFDDVKFSLAGRNDLLKTELGDGFEFYFMSISV